MGSAFECGLHVIIFGSDVVGFKVDGVDFFAELEDVGFEVGNVVLFAVTVFAVFFLWLVLIFMYNKKQIDSLTVLRVVEQNAHDSSVHRCDILNTPTNPFICRF